MGKYGKGEVNTNGYALLELAKSNNLKLTNTFFRHKPAHITTWESPERILDFIDSKSGTVRKNPYRNQVDYILIKNRQDIRVTNSRSYGGINTKSDHKLVLATVQTKWPYRKTSGNKTERIDYRKMSDTVKKEEYRERAEKIHLQKTVPTTNQQRWTKIVESSLEAAKEIFGTTKKKKFIEDNRLSE